MARERRRTSSQAVAGSGCGVVVLLLVVVPLGLAWLVLRWSGAGVPTPASLGGGLPDGHGWLVLSTVAAVAVLLAGLVLTGVMLLTDSVPNPLPRRLYLAWLLAILPVLAVLAIGVSWLCFAIGLPGAARGLAVVPWVAGLALALTAGVVYSGLDQ